jgi:8-oxo-dGTP pyrophosphatase MutT (NUDIX family)
VTSVVYPGADDTEMSSTKKVRRSAGGIVLLEGQVVLHRTALGNLNFPKGKIEKGETAEEAAIREVLEETGLVAQIVEPLGTLALLHIPKPQEIQYFLMRAVEESPTWPEHLDRDTLLAAPDEVPRRLTFKEYRRFWRQIAGRVLSADS